MSKKILWFSNYRFSMSPDCGTGTWIGSMGREIVASGKVELYNITTRCVPEIIYEEINGIRQWVLPEWTIGKSGLPDAENIEKVVEIGKRVNPDLTHVWGLESYYGLLVARGLIKGANLLEIQGIRHVIARFSVGYMSIYDQLKSYGVIELIKGCSVVRNRINLERARQHEIEILQSFDNIAYQSKYVRDWLQAYGVGARLHATRIALRKEFLNATRWSRARVAQGPTRILVTSNAVNPAKGLLVVIEAVALLKNAGLLPNGFRVRAVGATGVGRRLTLGYAKFLRITAKRLGVLDHIDFLGMLNGAQIVEEMLLASVYVCPSFTETYSLAAAEALVVGVPSVISYAGALPELAVDHKSALFFPAGDVGACAMRIREILADGVLAEALSKQSVVDGLNRNNIDGAVARQIEIYEHCCGNGIGR